MDRKRKKVSLRTIFIPIAAVVLFYVIQMTVSVIYAIVLSFTDIIKQGPGFFEIDPNAIQNLLIEKSGEISAISSVIVIILSLIAILIINRKEPKVHFSGRVGIEFYVSSVLTVLGVSGFVNIQMTVLMNLREKIPWIDKILSEYEELSKLFTDSNIYMLIISTCILVPVAEELVFRKIIQGELRRAMHPLPAILIQAVIFALVHGDAVQIYYVIIPGLILGMAYEWSGSIYVPIVMHMVFNFVGGALPQILADYEHILTYIFIAEIMLIPVGIIALLNMRSLRLDVKKEALVTETVGAEAVVTETVDAEAVDAEE